MKQLNYMKDYIFYFVLGFVIGSLIVCMIVYSNNRSQNQIDELRYRIICLEKSSIYIGNKLCSNNILNK